MIKKGVDQEKRRALAFCVGFLFEPLEASWPFACPMVAWSIGTVQAWGS
jgi:hypothetical protein